MSPILRSLCLLAGALWLTGSLPAGRTGRPAEGAIYWVSPEGTAAWADARSEAPLEGKDCCSIGSANARASAGDTVRLRGGTYATGIRPANSGAADRPIVFRAHSGEVPVFRVAGERAITVVGRSHIKVFGIHSEGSQAFFFLGDGACYNEIAHCVFDRSGGQYSVGLISFYDTAFEAGAPSDHNWLHHNVFSRYGAVREGNDLGTVRISGLRSDPSSHTTFEHNVFFYGGHDLLDIGGRFNVVRNNVFHNEEAYFEDTAGTSRNKPLSGFFGNRNVLLSNYGQGPGTAHHTLIEGNRIGHAGTPPDDDGSCGIENAGVHTVARYNDIYGNGGMGYYSKMQGDHPETGSALLSGSRARVYNNSVYANGFGDPSIDVQFKHGICVWSYRSYDDWPRDVVIKNNIVFGNANEWRVGSRNILPQITYANNFGSDPHFRDPDLSDKASRGSPDLRLRPGSPCIDKGIGLTAAVEPGFRATRLHVADAYVFQDGTWGSSLSGVRPDWIAIGTVDNVVEIRSISYEDGLIILAGPKTWKTRAPVWLFRDSDGRQVLHGRAPDIGAHESTDVRDDR